MDVMMHLLEVSNYTANRARIELDKKIDSHPGIKEFKRINRVQTLRRNMNLKVALIPGSDEIDWGKYRAYRMRHKKMEGIIGARDNAAPQKEIKKLVHSQWAIDRMQRNRWDRDGGRAPANIKREGPILAPGAENEFLRKEEPSKFYKKFVTPETKAAAVKPSLLRKYKNPLIAGGALATGVGGALLYKRMKNKDK